MARKSDGEKIDELEKLVAGIVTQVEIINQTLDALDDAGKEAGKEFNDLRRENERQIAELKKDIESLQLWAEKNGTSDVKIDLRGLTQNVETLQESQKNASNRAWSILPNIVGAVVNGLIAAIVAYSIARH